jgi:hypothetical protein
MKKAQNFLACLSLAIGYISATALNRSADHGTGATAPTVRFTLRERAKIFEPLRKKSRIGSITVRSAGLA